MKKRILLTFAVAALAACGDSDWLGDGNVTFEPKELSLSKSSLNELIVGETRRLYATFTPAETTDSDILWSSSDDAVATVDEQGAVRAAGLGEAGLAAAAAIDVFGRAAYYCSGTEACRDKIVCKHHRQKGLFVMILSGGKERGVVRRQGADGKCHIFDNIGGTCAVQDHYFCAVDLSSIVEKLLAECVDTFFKILVGLAL